MFSQGQNSEKNVSIKPAVFNSVCKKSVLECQKKSLILAILGLDNTSKYWLPVNCGSQLEFQQVAAYLGADRLQKHNLLLSFSFLLL